MPIKQRSVPLPVWLLCAAAILMAGCVGTRGAYKAAETLDEYAYVLTEHYAIVVKQAADLKDRSTTPAAVVQVLRAADSAAKPIFLGSTDPPRPSLRALAESFASVRDATTEKELQEAVDQAVLKLADLTRAVKAAEGN